MNKVTIIAEIANAHQGNSDILRALVRSAADSGADGVKFQWFKYDYLATPDHPLYSSYKTLFIDEQQWLQTLELADNLALKVWVDIFDHWGMDLAERHKDRITGFKIPATILEYDSIIEKILSWCKPVLLGVGGWHPREIDQFIAGLASAQLARLILVHGFQGYPTRAEDAKLSRIEFLEKRFNLPVGFADHTDASTQLAVDLPVYAVCFGARLIEKHITLDRSKKGYDYYSALEPHEFSRMVCKLREVEKVYGSPEVNQRERDYLKVNPKVVARRDIGEGEIVTVERIAYKRCPDETALTPRQFKDKLPGLAAEDIKENQPVTPQSLAPPKIVIAVVCRLKSTRLPNKALLPLNGIAAIERCLLNCLAVKQVHQVVLATSWLTEDDALARFTMDGAVTVVRDDPDNVAKRLIQVARQTGANILLRITGDCPAVSPEILSILIESHLESGADLTLPTAQHPPGTAGDVYTVQALKGLLRQRTPLSHTEYLSFYFVNNPRLFTVNRVELPKQYRYPQWRLTLDELPDYELFKHLYSVLAVKGKPLYFETVRRYLLENPQVAKINSEIQPKWVKDKNLARELKNATTLQEQ